MSQMRQELELARELIAEKQYEKARMLLRRVKDDPTAQKWLDKLDQIAPVRVPVEVSVGTGGVEPWQYAAIEVKRSYGIQYRINGEAHPEWKDQPIYLVLNELGREGWELVGFESSSEYSLYLLKRRGSMKIEKAEVWDQ